MREFLRRAQAPSNPNATCVVNPDQVAQLQDVPGCVVYERKSMTMTTGKVFLVGAGPGDPELITLKGVNALRLADVVMYDRLAHPDLLNHAPDACNTDVCGQAARQGRHAQARI